MAASESPSSSGKARHSAATGAGPGAHRKGVLAAPHRQERHPFGRVIVAFPEDVFQEQGRQRSELAVHFELDGLGPVTGLIIDIRHAAANQT